MLLVDSWLLALINVGFKNIKSYSCTARSIRRQGRKPQNFPLSEIMPKQAECHVMVATSSNNYYVSGLRPRIEAVLRIQQQQRINMLSF